jgi:hypothetical protein
MCTSAGIASLGSRRGLGCLGHLQVGEAAAVDSLSPTVALQTARTDVTGGIGADDSVSVRY